jgi:predicted extracellular nuclease
LLTAAVTVGIPSAPVASVKVDLSAVGGSATQTMFDNGSNGDAVSGDLTYSFLVTVPAAVAEGTRSLPVTITDALNRIGTATIALTVQQPPPSFVAIHDIQGPGSRSPYAGLRVMTHGVVTAQRFNNGFFIQTPDAQADADPSTSEGVFVFTNTGNIPAAAAIGNIVEVTGTVQEFIPSTDPNSPPETEIAGTLTVSQLSTGNPLPAAVTLTAADADLHAGGEAWERFEGMRVHVESLTVVAPTQGNINEANATGSTNGVYYGVISGVARPFREPGLELPDPLPAGAPCCVPRFDANPERLRVDSNGQVGFGPNDTTEVMAGAIVTGMTGVLDYGSRAYTILPDVGAQGVTGNLHDAIPVTVPRAHQFTVGTANIERFFDTVNDPGISDVQLTAAAFSNRLNKVSKQIRDVMRSPDIIGFEEVENLSVLQAIANKVNADSAAGGSADPQYQAYLLEGNDVGGIDVGFLVKSTLMVSCKDATGNVGPPSSINVIVPHDRGK